MGPVIYAGVSGLVAVLSAHGKRGADRQIDATPVADDFKPKH